MIFNDNLASTKKEIERASQGMKRPTVVLLSAGDRIFRIASTKKASTGEPIPSSDWASGSWWFAEADYARIVSRFQAGKLPLGTVARSAGAVQPSWSLMDVSIKAELLHDVYVYVGKGSTQYRDQLPNGWFVTSKGWPDINQIYIPGMRTGTRAAIRVLTQKIIQTNTFGF